VQVFEGIEIEDGWGSEEDLCNLNPKGIVSAVKEKAKKQDYASRLKE